MEIRGPWSLYVSLYIFQENLKRNQLENKIRGRGEDGKCPEIETYPVSRGKYFNILLTN